MGKIQMHKVDDKTNLADLGPKDVEEALNIRSMGGVGFKEEAGRHPKALKVSHGLGGYGEDLLAQTDDVGNEKELI
eukprot:8309237-Pyramimonas_sp.AAC.1